MKRSRRVVLTMMGSAAAGAVSMGFAPGQCGPDAVAVRMSDGRLVCRPRYGTGYSYGGFGGTPHHFHGHGHAGNGFHFDRECCGQTDPSRKRLWTGSDDARGERGPVL